MRWGRRDSQLPIRMGGLGITNTAVTADMEYNASKNVTENLVKMIVNQDIDLKNYDEEKVNEKNKLKFAGKKIGSNEPCFCGSGKKFKHCCGAL